MAEVPPFSTLVTWNETIKESWEEDSERAPIPHAELLTLAELAIEADMNLDVMIANLAANNVDVVSPNTVVGMLAEKHALTPIQIYTMALGESRHGSGKGRAGGGPGQKTLAEFCADEGLDLDLVLGTLQATGVAVDSTTVMRDIVQTTDIKPCELVDMLRAAE